MDIFTRLGAKNIAKILRVLTSDVAAGHVRHENISSDNQRKYIKKYGASLPLEDKKTLCNLIIMNDKREEIKQCNTGCVIDLDNLSDNIIEQLYIFVAYRNESHDQ
jgi:hypothetical protein